MDLQTLFAHAILCRPPVIHGRRLHHFSAYHALVLSAFDSPFVKGGKITYADLVVALWVCGTQYDPAEGLGDIEQITEDVRQWAAEVGEMDAVAVADGIEAYIDQYLQLPRMWSKGERSKIPSVFKLVATVAAEYSWPERDVWNMPFNRLVCYRACMAESCGGQVVDDMHQRVIDRLKADGLEWKPPAEKEEAPDG